MVGLLTVILVFFLLLTLMGLFVSIRPPRIHSPVHPGDLRLPYEEIDLITSDGLRLSGWYIPQDHSEKAIIALHGYPADKGDILPAVSFLHDEFSLLLFDFRYFGSSEGFYTTAGAREIRDLSAALDHLRGRGIHRIGLWGFSMGGAVALMSAEFPGDIRAIVSESSYAELAWMARETYRLFFFLKYPLAFMTGLWAKLLLGIDLNEISPARAVQNSRTPVLLIHSDADEVIPFAHALRLREGLSGNSDAEFWFPQGFRHGQHPPDYENRIRAFFIKHLSSP